MAPAEGEQDAAADPGAFPVRRLPELVLALLMFASGGLLLSLTSGIGFLSDEWQFLFFRQGFEPGMALSAYYEHLLVIPTYVYSTLIELFGMDSARPIQVVAILAFLGMNVLLYIYLRRRVGAWAAVIGTGLILFLGAAFEDLLLGFQLNYYGAMACGLGALIALDRDDRRGDLFAALLLVAGIGFSSLIFPFLAAAVVEWMLNPRERRRRIFVPGTAIGLWVLWWLGWGHEAESGFELAGVGDLPSYLFTAIPAAFTSLVGLATGDGSSPDQPHLIWGRIICLVALAAAGWRIYRLGRVPRDVWITLAAALSFFTLAGINSDEYRLPTSSRYQLPGGLLILLVAANLLRGIRIPRAALVVAAALAVLAAFGGIRLMEREATERWEPASFAARLSLGAIDLAGPAIAPGYQIDLRTNPDRDRLIPIGLYRETTDRHGSPGLPEAEIAAAPAASRAWADALIIEATGIVVSASPRGAAGACLRVRGQGGVFGPYEAGPGSYVINNGGKGELGVSLTRFADPPGQPVGSILPRSFAGLDLPLDAATRPWRINFTGEGPVSVCETS